MYSPALAILFLTLPDMDGGSLLLEKLEKSVIVVVVVPDQKITRIIRLYVN